MKLNYSWLELPNFKINVKLPKFFQRKPPEIIFLVGVPGSGKSTLVKKMKLENKWHKHVILSTDAYMEEQAKYLDKNYDEIFEKLYPVAEEKFYENLNNYYQTGNEILFRLIDEKLNEF